MMVSIDALIGFEENGGFMYGKHLQVRDGIMTLALILDLLSSSDKTFSEEIETLPSSFTTKDKISCSAHDAKKIINELKLENPNADITDGIKIIFNEKKWIMIRPSGTEPIVRIYAEATSKDELDKIMLNYIQKIKLILSR
jgi:phosphomannomutase/phosphoglucomutase